MTRILGIDPGSRFTGFGVIDIDGNHAKHVANGCIKVKGET
ncbi:MAG: crossover junction endodeoxyribonuclease RuvC, partial [Gammaproteobacteria bacterium]